MNGRPTPVSAARRALALLGLSLSLCGTVAWAQGAAPASPAPVRPIASLDVPRYMGLWHEVARYPNGFQKKCVGDSTALYRLEAQGRVSVLNRCRTAEGGAIEAAGTARQIGARTSPTLQVRFAPAWLSFIPWVWGDYWVIDLDPDYTLVAVGEPSREYLWVLSRSPTVDETRYAALLERLKRQGFDTLRLQRTPVTP